MIPTMITKKKKLENKLKTNLCYIFLTHSRVNKFCGLTLLEGQFVNTIRNLFFLFFSPYLFLDLLICLYLLFLA